MSSQHEIHCSYEREVDGNIVESAEVVIHFSFSPGSADYWDRRLGCYLPGDPEEIEFDHAEQDLGGGKRKPACEVLSEWAADWLDEHHDEAREVAWECLSQDRDDAAESRRELAMLDRELRA